MNRFLRIFAALLVSSVPAFMNIAVAEDAKSTAVEDKIRAMVPNAKTIAVSETPIDAILQVQIDNEIVYVSSDGKYLLQGQIMEIDTRINITDQAKSGIRKSMLAGLNPDEQITFSPAKVDFDLLVFTDIDCGYCRKLHSQIDEYSKQGIAIHYLAFPRAGIGSGSYNKYVSVWCADDQNAALTLAKNGVDPEPKTCPNPITDQYQLGRTIGVTGTPALVTYDGTLIPGYMPPERLRNRLEELQTTAE